tara:strand:- start:19784 stop:21646 length:1863 start_codon:yes stop_codon:yes gene_type:complete
MAQLIFTLSDDVNDIKKKEVAPDGALTIINVAHEAGVNITATCGERGRCRACRIKILSGQVPPPTMQDRIQLGEEEIRDNFRLACQTRVIGDANVLLAPPTEESGYQIMGSDLEATAAGLNMGSGVNKYYIKAKAPVEEHHQTSDIEEVLSCLPETVNKKLSLHILRQIPGVLRAKGGGMTVTTFNDDIISIEADDTSEKKFGMAFDIGTTSIVGNLLDLDSGEQLATVGNVNPQAQFGGDLMSRIAYAMFDTKKLTALRSKALNAITGFIKEACETASIKPEQIHKVVIVGNTCMHHVFLGVDTTYVGLAPYAPVVRSSLVFHASELPLKGAPNAVVCFLPIVAGFVGADTIACILATKIYESDKKRALVDIGTNGEVVMGDKEELMACSAPAGPALEGAQIRHGMRGAVGAIEKVNIENDVNCTVIGNAPAIGICGSGLIDAAAAMLKSTVMNPSGLLQADKRDNLPDSLSQRFSKTDDGKDQFTLVKKDESGRDEDIVLTQNDIRQLQLAKGAIVSGIIMLQKVMEIADEELDELMLCGGFGNYISIQSAVDIKLLPNLPVQKITYVGNAAHLGAQMALLSEDERHRADDIAKEINHVALATHPDFQEIFVEALKFG